MDNFKAFNPTYLLFGKDVVRKLGKTTREFGDKTLLIYGKGSIKRNGIYDSVKNVLRDENVHVFEFSGVKSNPVFEDVDAAAQIVKKYNIDTIIAVGGGSVLDTAKMISITAKVKHSCWDFIMEKSYPTEAVPVICVLTLAATGSEMNPYAVIQNDKTKQKIGYGHPLLYPKYSFLDPSYTLTVSDRYTSYSIVDIIAHCLEAYFGKGNCDLTDKISISIIKETMHKGLKLINDSDNYELRADIMLASTLALNGITFYGKSYGDWGVHSIGHELSVLYDMAHGASLSIAFVAWLKILAPRIPDRIIMLGKELFENIETVDDVISNFMLFYKKIDAPVKISDVVKSYNKEQILNQLKINKVNGSCYNLSQLDYSKLVDYMCE